MTRRITCIGCGKAIPDTSKFKCPCRKRNKVKKEPSETDKLMRTKRWERKRQFIMKRDGCCQRCKIKYGIIETNDMTIHHIKSRKHHPELFWEDDNLMVLCRSCNSQLGLKELDFDYEPIEYEPTLG